MHRRHGFRIGRTTAWVRTLLVAACLAPANAAQPTPSPGEQAVVDEMSAAIERVKRIVNQPVEALPRTPDARVATFRPGWFHSGAAKPAFATVDVRKSRTLPYEGLGYVTSDLNPGLMFRGEQLEFNPKTKYFYDDRSRPKKRLSDAEMEEINRLYRIIGRCEERLARLRGPAAPPVSAEPPPARSPFVFVAGGVLIALATAAAHLLRGRR